MTDDKSLVAAVKEVRPQLAEMLDEADLALIDRLVDGEPSTADIDAVAGMLDRNPKARAFVAEELVRLDTRYRGVDEPAGAMRPVDADVYRCPDLQCPFIWERQLPGQTPPPCEYHGIPLVPRS